MLRKKQGEIEWLEFESLQQFSKLRHAVFLRHGGVSSGPFASLNVSASVGDNPAAVRENRRRIEEIFPGRGLVVPRIVHGVDVEVVRSPFSVKKNCDGLLTEKEGLSLLITHADCQAALFYDPIQHLLANVHCGWRGNVQNIYGKTVDLFKARGSCPENIFVCISPSLGPSKAEFMHYETEWPRSFWDFRVDNSRFDLWSLSRFQLEAAGVLSKHIEQASICTYEEKTDYFSYRRDKITGRQGTVAQLL